MRYKKKYAKYYILLRECVYGYNDYVKERFEKMLKNNEKLLEDNKKKRNIF